MFAETAARALGYALTEAGVTVNGQSRRSSPCSCSARAPTTRCCSSRATARSCAATRTSTRRCAIALRTRRARRSSPPALTVIAALLCLSLAEVNGTAGLGPIGAMGVGLAMVSMLTLLPALLAICRPPGVLAAAIPHFGDEGADETHGAWRRVGDRVAARPAARLDRRAPSPARRSPLGLPQLRHGPDPGNAFRDAVESVEGQELLAQVVPGRRDRADRRHRPRRGQGAPR